MRGGVLPAALLCFALGMVLAFAPGRTVVPALVLLCASAVATSLFAPSRQWLEVAFLGCWLSVILLSTLVHWPREVPHWLALAAAADAGSWAGMVIAQEGRPTDLILALPCVLAALPARWLIGRGWGIALKVICSWLLAVALLASLLPTASTPGYMPDHEQ